MKNKEISFLPRLETVLQEPISLIPIKAIKPKKPKILIFTSYLAAHNHAVKHGIKRQIKKTGFYRFEL